MEKRLNKCMDSIKFKVLDESMQHEKSFAKILSLWETSTEF